MSNITTNNFHEAKSNLESAIISFIEAAQKDDRDVMGEFNEALFVGCKEAGHKILIAEEE